MALTDRLEIRLPVEIDRSRFVELFTDESFMVFAGVCDTAEANARFDEMLATAHDIPFAKQPVIESVTGQIIGYCGVARFELENQTWLEFGYRLCVEARGNGYATEAGRALLETARTGFTGTILAMINPTNLPSMNVITKLGFAFWKQATVDGYLDNLYRIELT